MQIAEQHGLVIHENYMFIYHDQLKVLDDMVASGIIGDIRFTVLVLVFLVELQATFVI